MTSQETHFHPLLVPAQVDGEQGLGNKSLLDHVVKDRHNIVRGDALEGQPQDAIGCHLSHERSFCLADPKHLVWHRDASHLYTQDSCQSQFNRTQRFAFLQCK